VEWDSADGASARPETLALDEVRLFLDTHANRVADRYFDLLRSPRAQAVLSSGWCSWYHYYTKVSASDMRANLAVAGANKVDLECPSCLDDGYPSAIGDWLEPNYKFPQGLEPIARDMRERGFPSGSGGLRPSSPAIPAASTPNTRSGSSPTRRKISPCSRLEPALGPFRVWILHAIDPPTPASKPICAR